MSTWQVRRHGGRWNTAWRVVFQGSKDLAFARFHKLMPTVRRGVLTLEDERGNVVTWVSA